MVRLIDADEIPWFVEGVGEIPVVTREEIDEMPTVEAKPVRHAQLIFVGMDEKGNGLYECTQCHVGGVVCSTIPVGYCQYCGARICGDNYDAERKEE